MISNKIKKYIDDVKVVSFDIFDTLLVRPYVKPIDVFEHMEKHFNAPFFASCRITAECVAREKNPDREDIMFDAIYDEIDDNFKYLKSHELEWEENVLQPHPYIQEIWQFAKQSGKKIVVASDMYLPTKFVAKVLKKNGFGDYDKLYVSGDLNVTKCHGTMFDAIVRDMGVKPGDILHIGDNEHSDYKIPRKKGMRAIKIPRLVDQFIDKNPRIQRFWSTQYEKLGASILVSMLAINRAKNANNNYWHEIGYEYGGPVTYGYTRWIERVAMQERIQHLFFVARDGWTLQKVFNTFNSKMANSYVYAPRMLNLICRLDYDKYDIMQSKCIVDFFVNKNKKIAKLAESFELRTWQDYHKFIQNNKDMFSAAAQKEHESYKAYLCDQFAKKSEKIAIVDTITGRFSSQKIVQSALQKNVVAFYWGILKCPFTGVYDVKEFIKNNQKFEKVFTKNWNFMEFLMTSPEYPIKMVEKGKPIYDPNPSIAEQTRHAVYPFVSDGAVAFANDVKKLFDGADIYLDASTLVTWINCLCDVPTSRDIKEFAVIKHAYDAKHSDYIPLFSTKVSLREALKRPRHTLRMIRSLVWRTKLQSLMLALYKPLSIKMHGVKMLRILFFPTLKWRYFNITLRFGKRWVYTVSVGKPKEF